MTVERLGIVEGRPGLPIISRAVVHGDVVYLCGVTPDPVGGIDTQTRQVLEHLDALLRAAGTAKSKLLTAHIWLSDMVLFAEHNAAWNDWIDAKNPPARTCAQAGLWQPARWWRSW